MLERAQATMTGARATELAEAVAAGELDPWAAADTVLADDAPS
jgi:hypothetical protein